MFHYDTKFTRDQLEPIMDAAHMPDDSKTNFLSCLQDELDTRRETAIREERLEQIVNLCNAHRRLYTPSWISVERRIHRLGSSAYLLLLIHASAIRTGIPKTQFEQSAVKTAAVTYVFEQAQKNEPVETGLFEQNELTEIDAATTVMEGLRKIYPGSKRMRASVVSTAEIAGLHAPFRRHVKDERQHIVHDPLEQLSLVLEQEGVELKKKVDTEYIHELNMQSFKRRKKQEVN